MTIVVALVIGAFFMWAIIHGGTRKPSPRPTVLFEQRPRREDDDAN